MTEREMLKSKELEARQVHFYEDIFNQNAAKRERASTGRIVIKGPELPWEKSRQAILKYYLHPSITDTAVDGWLLFIQDIRSRSGKHRHQGGLAIYVLEGTGWTTVDGVRHDWEAGDLILLPIKPRGVEHQHFNAEPGAPCKWLALVRIPWDDAVGNEMEQTELAPDFIQG